jgi:hypothetical protein
LLTCPWLLLGFTLKMEVVLTSETSENLYQTTWCYTPNDITFIKSDIDDDDDDDDVDRSMFILK